MKIASLYCRVSTGRQEKEATIESQIAEVADRIKLDGNVLGENLKFLDDGWSGDLLARPGLDQMRDSAEKKEFEVLYVWDRDRIARKYAYQEIILEELQNLGIEIIDLHSAKVESPEDKILLGFKGLFAEYEKVKIGERMRRGKLFKARNGHVVLGPGPFGYRYICRTKENQGYYEIDEEEALVVKQMFDLIGNDGLTIRRLIKRLYNSGVFPRKSKNGYWSSSTVGRLLRNESYIGTTYYNKGQATEPKNPQNKEKYKRIKRSSRILKPKEDWIAISIPSIIDKELFYKTQEQLKINALHSPRNKKHDYLLSGLIYCECGKRMGCEGGIRNFYYRCQNRLRRYPLPQDCFGSGVNTERVDIPVWNKVQEFLNNPDLIRQQAERWLSKQEVSYEETEIGETKKALTKVDEEEKRQAKAYGEGVISYVLFKKMIEDIKNRREALEKRLQDATNKKNQASLTPRLTVDQIVKAIPNVVQKMVHDDKRVLLQKIIKQIEVDKARNYAKIVGYVPIEFNEKEVELNVNYRDCWAAKCW